MPLKTGKMTPRCPKQLSSDEYPGESQHPADEYTDKSRLPSGEYTGEATFSVLWRNIRTALQKHFLVNSRPGSQDFLVY
jgi:hypothetical protein